MIALHASHLAGCGHEVVIMTNVADTVFALDARVRTEPMPFGGTAGTLLSAVTSRFSADLVIADIIPLACLLALRNRNRTVYFAQDYDESYYTSQFMKLLIRFLYFLGLRILKIKTIAVAEHLAFTFQNVFGSKSVIVENGVDTGVFFRQTDPALLASKESRKSVLILSRRDPRKGFDIALRVIDSLPENVAENIEIWTVGESAGSFSNVFCQRDFGYVSESRLRQIMSSADMFLYPSRHEGFPLMVIEAFACHCPVVTTEAVPYARHGINALVAHIGDAGTLAEMLLSLLDSDELGRRLSDSGLSFAKRHSLHQSLSDFESSLISIRNGQR